MSRGSGVFVRSEKGPFGPIYPYMLTIGMRQIA
jgi:hypothetical protein